MKIPYIPTEKEIDNLIANAGPKTSAALRVAKETGARIGEILRLRWTDLDPERRTIKFEAEKGSNPRILPASYELIATLQALSKRNEYIFSTSRGRGSQKDYSRTLALTRKYAARKLQNQRLLQIHFHTLRHWKATMEYHKTKDIIHVKQVLGHKKIDNTMIYINLEQALFQSGDSSEYITRVTKTVKGTRALLEAGFEYVIDMDGLKLFRRRK